MFTPQHATSEPHPRVRAIGASTAGQDQVDHVEVVVPSDDSDADAPDILREPSKHLPGRREDLECLVGGRNTTEKSAFVRSKKISLWL